MQPPKGCLLGLAHETATVLLTQTSQTLADCVRIAPYSHATSSVRCFLNYANIPKVIKLTQVWQLGEQINTGGFATVYAAQSDDTQSAVVKLIPKAKGPGVQRELQFEELTGIPNVVPIIDQGECKDYWVLVMPLADKSLRIRINEAADQLSTIETLSILIDITKALVAIDEHVVHRDIKPENILLLNDHWCLADFGIARYAEATTAVDTWKSAMTAAYAAPEQWRRERATNATDIYSLGVVAYELLNGSRPFQGPDYGQQHLTDPPKKISDIPIWLWSLVNECLMKSPQARPRAQNLLNRLKKRSHSVSPAALQMQQANALAVETQAEAERQHSIAQAKEDRRHELYAAAQQSLTTILHLLRQEIMENAPSAQVATDTYSKEWTLNTATLRVENCKMVQLDAMVDLSFEVAAYSTIQLSALDALRLQVGRSHSLWYCNAQDPQVFRWYETAFWGRRYNRQRQMEPYALSPDERDAVLALNRTGHSVRVARPFTSIDQGEENVFIEQWLGRFAEAAQGRLNRPSHMPEIDPRYSWRR